MRGKFQRSVSLSLTVCFSCRKLTTDQDLDSKRGFRCQSSARCKHNIHNNQFLETLVVSKFSQSRQQLHFPFKHICCSKLVEYTCKCRRQCWLSGRLIALVCLHAKRDATTSNQLAQFWTHGVDAGLAQSIDNKFMN